MHTSKLLATLAIIILIQTASLAGPACTTVTPAEDTAAVLHNPDMGWVLYENYPLDQRPGGSSTLVALPGEAFPEVDEAAIMFSWQDVEKSKGVYDFSKVDYAYDYWKTRGKRIQLRMSTESLLWWSNLTPPTGKGIPDYVLDAIPSAKKQTRTCEGLAYTVVDARDAYYLDRLSRFLRAVARHFRTRPVTLVDLRGFGLWGEWHSGYRYATVEDRIQALKRIIDCWSTNLSGYTLALSYSHDPDSPPEYYSGSAREYSEKDTAHYADFLRYSAFDYALTKPNITLRRDGAGAAVYSNQRRLNREAFDTLTRGPMMSEFCGGYYSTKQAGPEFTRWYIDDALSLHPNYVCLLGWQSREALDFCREQPELVKRGLLTMGYRLVPVEATYPPKLAASMPAEISTLWVNRGVGRAKRDFRLRLSLVRGGGSVAGEADLGPVGTSRWVRGRYYCVNKQAMFGAVPPGEYGLLIALVDPVTGRAIELPLSGVRVGGAYKIGTVTVVRD